MDKLKWEGQVLQEAKEEASRARPQGDNRPLLRPGAQRGAITTPLNFFEMEQANAICNVQKSQGWRRLKNGPILLNLKSISFCSWFRDLHLQLAG